MLSISKSKGITTKILQTILIQHLLTSCSIKQAKYSRPPNSSCNLSEAERSFSKDRPFSILPMSLCQKIHILMKWWVTQTKRDWLSTTNGRLKSLRDCRIALGKFQQHLSMTGSAGQPGKSKQGHILWCQATKIDLWKFELKWVRPQ